MSEQNVTIPAEVWKQTLIKVDIIKAEFERLKDEIIAHRNLKAENSSLQAENERLRKAGNAMYQTAVEDSTGLWIYDSFEKWHIMNHPRSETGETK
jgi:hypothetical protein